MIGGGKLAEATRLLQGAGEGFLTIDVLAELHRRHCDGRVQVVGCADHDRVDLLVFLVEKFAPVLENLRAGMGLVELLGAAEIDLGHGDEGRVGCLKARPLVKGRGRRDGGRGIRFIHATFGRKRSRGKIPVRTDRM